MAVSSLWGSNFSRRDGQALIRQWKARPFRPVGIARRVPVEVAVATPEGLLQQVLALRGERR